jgi:cell division protein FtsI (penicillin-binding protein 3)
MLKQWMARLLVGRTTVGNTLTDERPDPEFETTWRAGVRQRLGILAIVVGLWAVAIEAKLAMVQLVEHQGWAARADKQQFDKIKLPSVRGDIVDRTGQVLAMNVPGYEVYVDQIAAANLDARAEAEEICRAFGDCSPKDVAAIATKLKGDSRSATIRLAADTTQEIVARIRKMNVQRSRARKPVIVNTIAKSVRLYPKKDLAAHVIGAVDIDGKGIAGLEAKFDEQVAGSEGLVHVQVDGRTRDRGEIYSEVVREPTVGAGLELTIHAGLQHFVERELALTVQREHAKGGTVLVLDPFSGDVLAMANVPTFNPNLFAEATDEGRINRAIQAVYEPGSTMKIVTAAAALSEGLMTPSTLVDCNPGVHHVPGRGKPITEDKGKNYGVLTFEDVLIRSSNVCSVRIGDRLGTDTLMLWVRRFGFGDKLMPDFSGESRGMVKPASVIDDSGRASISMGYEIAVTPLQLATATSVIANGGTLVQPRIVRAVLRSNGQREEREPRALHGVVSPEIAATMTAIMEGVVDKGTGKQAALDGYQVAGKTGTAKKFIGGRYSDVDYDVSFTGFVPARRPAFTILAVIDRPRVSKPYGGTIAAPLFKRVAEAAIHLIGVPPSINPAPPVLRAATPPPARRADVLSSLTQIGGRPVMPDLTGLNIREALGLLHRLQIHVTAEGDGSVVAQSPAAGTVLAPGMTGVLRLRRQPAERGESR